MKVLRHALLLALIPFVFIFGGLVCVAALLIEHVKLPINEC